MLKVEINGKEGIQNVVASGNLLELMADITNLLSIMYENISDDCKQDFNDCVKKLAEEELYTKNEEEIKELAKKSEEEVKEKLKQEIKKFLDDLFEEKKKDEIIS